MPDRTIGKITSVGGIRDAYSRRILGYLIGKDPLTVYRRTPGELARLTRGMTRKELLTPPLSGKWSISRLVSHLCDAEIILSKRLQLFAAMRASNIGLVRTLSSGELKRAGIHSERGRETVERMIQLLAGHDINHLMQVKNVRRTIRRK